MSGSVIAAVILLAMTSFCATSVWALFGSVIKSYLHHPQVKVVINVILSLFLLYTAVVLAGLL